MSGRTCALLQPFTGIRTNLRRSTFTSSLVSSTLAARQVWLLKWSQSKICSVQRKNAWMTRPALATLASFKTWRQRLPDMYGILTRSHLAKMKLLIQTIVGQRSMRSAWWLRHKRKKKHRTLLFYTCDKDGKLKLLQLLRK